MKIPFNYKYLSAILLLPAWTQAQNFPTKPIRIVIGTSLVGFITIPLWRRLGMRFVPH